VFHNRLLRGVFGPKREVYTGNCRGTLLLGVSLFVLFLNVEDEMGRTCSTHAFGWKT
jgi:hypothetical protein